MIPFPSAEAVVSADPLYTRDLECDNVSAECIDLVSCMIIILSNLIWFILFMTAQLRGLLDKDLHSRFTLAQVHPTALPLWIIPSYFVNIIIVILFIHVHLIVTVQYRLLKLILRSCLNAGV